MKYFFILFLVLLAACETENFFQNVAEEKDNSFWEKDSEHAEMLRIHANGKSVKLGSVMTVDFTYDFSIDRREVTCGEFQVRMNGPECAFSNFPATNVTFFDAVLFANAKSKDENLDTVYTYSSAKFDSEGHCYNLVDYAFHPEVNAYRLPTESEWSIVASDNWLPYMGWSADNSDYLLHEPCTAADTAGGTCDFAGNAMEWVNDWKGVLRDTSVINYVGASDGGSLGERVVKGGSFRNPATAIKLENRGDIYTVTSTIKGDYIGFRLAFGKIPDALWMNNNGSATTKPIRLITSSVELKQKTESLHSKLVFRNDETGNIGFVNYANGILTAHEFVDSVDGYHPVISPDGNWVAYCTKPEGISGPSALYVRNLNSSNTNAIKLDVENAAIPRWHVVGADTEIVYVSSAGNNSDKVTWRKESTWKVPFENEKFGIPVQVFNGTYNGGVSTDGNVAVSGSRLLRAYVNGKEETWYGEEQACNVSLSSFNQTLFLDFGGKRGQEFAGSSYNAHEQLLIADSTGNLVQMIPAPAGYAFDHTEWISGSRSLVVATLTDKNGAHSKIVLVNIADSSITELAEGADLWHPDLWIDKMDSVELTLELDSAGVYFTVNGSAAAVILRYKMELLWNNLDSTNVVILGSSRAMNGIHPKYFSSKFKALNLANIPNMMFVSNYLAKNYVLPHLKNLRYLIVSLDVDLWNKAENSDYNFFYQEYKNYPGFVYDANHQFWENDYPKSLGMLTRESMGVDFYRRNLTDSAGYNYAECDGWESSQTLDYDSTWMDTESFLFEQALSNFDEILELAQKRSVYVIGVVFPQSPNFKNTGSFGRYGIRRSESKNILNRIQRLQETYSNFIFVDENKMGNHDYTDSMAQNRDHLCFAGAKQMTERLNSLLQSLK